MALLVEKIENGTVIDHLSAGLGFKILSILGYKNNSNNMLALVINASSKRLGKKDIVKLQDVFLTQNQINKIAVLCKTATINVIKNSELKEKFQVSLPKQIQVEEKCPNPKCIVNQEDIMSVFFVESYDKLRCKYCERTFSPKEVF